MSENDVTAVLRAISDFQATVERKIDGVYGLVHDVCERVQSLEEDRAVREERRRIERDMDKRRINWAQVRTLSVVAASGFLILAAVKFLLLNMDKWLK